MRSHAGFGLFRLLEPLAPQQDVPASEPQRHPENPLVGPEGGRVPLEVEAAIRRAQGGGRPLYGVLHAEMSARLGHDFSEVRIHTGSEADRLSRRLGARAFTIGTEVFFEGGAYDPGSPGGRELIAHELVHVVQQSTGRVPAEGSGWTVRPSRDGLERQAAALARETVTPHFRESGIERRIAPRSAARIAGRPSVIQRTAADCANHARRGMSGTTRKYRPNSCNEAALGWLLKGMGKTHPWQLMRQLASNCMPPFAVNVSDWLWRIVYQTRNQVRKGHVMQPPTLVMPQPLQRGDILVTEGPLPAIRALHSLVIVSVQPHVSVRGFNNMGTFHGAGGKYNRTTAGYDAFDLEIDDPHLWGAAPWSTAFGAGARRPLYRVRYADASARLNAIINAAGHWNYNFFRTPGWQHDAPACGVPNCPPNTIQL